MTFRGNTVSFKLTIYLLDQHQGVEQLSNWHILKMATQQKNTASSKEKVTAKISSPRKPAPKMKKTDLRDLKEDKEFTDVTLACEDGQQVGAHKVVLIAPSPFFEKNLGFSPLCLFKCFFKSHVWEYTKSHWLHLSILCFFKCVSDWYGLFPRET